MKYKVKISREGRRNVFQLRNADNTTISGIFGGVYGYATNDRSLAAVESEMTAVVGEENRDDVKIALKAAVERYLA